MTIVPRWTVQIAIAETLALDNRQIERAFGIPQTDVRKRRRLHKDVIADYRDVVQRAMDSPKPPSFLLPKVNVTDMITQAAVCHIAGTPHSWMAAKLDIAASGISRFLASNSKLYTYAVQRCLIATLNTAGHIIHRRLVFRTVYEPAELDAIRTPTKHQNTTRRQYSYDRDLWKLTIENETRTAGMNLGALFANLILDNFKE